jgi:hypothetical protein
MAEPAHDIRARSFAITAPLRRTERRKSTYLQGLIKENGGVEKLDRSKLSELLPAKAWKKIERLGKPSLHGHPKDERHNCIIVATLIETELHDDARGLLDRETLLRHAEQERELAGLFKQLLDAQRKEGRY